MTKIFLLTSLFIPFCLFGQVRGVVIDKESTKPIPYANIWVENMDIGTTSNEKGEFSFSDTLINKNLIVSSVGYESQRLLVSSSNIKILLLPKVYELKEVVIYSKGIKKMELGKFKKSKIISFYNSGGKPWIAARYFNYDTIYEETPFIKNVDLLTTSENDSSNFRLRIMSVGANGEPSSDLINEQIIIKVKKGKNITTIDLSKFRQQIPKEGFFVAVEWLDIENNRMEFVQIDNKSGNKCKKKKYNPSIGNIIENDSSNGWIYVYGSWHKPFQIKAHIKDYYGKYRNIAAKITMTN